MSQIELSYEDMKQEMNQGARETWSDDSGYIGGRLRYRRARARLYMGLCTIICLILLIFIVLSVIK